MLMVEIVDPAYLNQRLSYSVYCQVSPFNVSDLKVNFKSILIGYPLPAGKRFTLLEGKSRIVLVSFG